jgi:hypothetical protein
VTHGNNVNQRACVFNRVDDPVIADTDAPEILAALKFLQPAGRGSVAKDSILGKIRSTNDGGSFWSSLRAERLKVTTYSATELPRPNQRPFHSR